MKALSALLVSGALGLAGCVMGPSGGSHIQAEAADMLEPVDAPAEFVVRTYTGPVFNSAGGEIPRAAPTGEVEEEGLEDVPSG